MCELFLYRLLYRLRLNFVKDKNENEEEATSGGTLFARLFEGFIESAPQLVLQLYIMTQMSNVRLLTGMFTTRNDR